MDWKCYLKKNSTKELFIDLKFVGINRVWPC